MALKNAKNEIQAKNRGDRNDLSRMHDLQQSMRLNNLENDLYNKKN